MVLDTLKAKIGAAAPSRDELIDRYFDDVYRFTSRRLRREDAEDATSETFHAALNQLHRLRGSDPLLWLFGIARRKVANAQRRAYIRKEEFLYENIPSPQGKSPEQSEADSHVRKIVMSLPNDQREALLLQHLEELSVAQIAAVLRKSESAVNSLLHRARTTAYTRGHQYFAPEEEVKL